MCLVRNFLVLPPILGIIVPQGGFGGLFVVDFGNQRSIEVVKKLSLIVCDDTFYRNGREGFKRVGFGRCNVLAIDSKGLYGVLGNSRL